MGYMKEGLNRRVTSVSQYSYVGELDRQTDRHVDRHADRHTRTEREREKRRQTEIRTVLLVTLKK